jgi:hypothetical protein
MALWQWSTTPANNASAGAIDWAEGQPPSTVNDSARQMMADVATWFANPEWLNYGDVPTYVSATQFTVPANLTSRYSVGRRVKAIVTAGAIYGSISSSVYTSLTTVTVAWDSGSLDGGLSEVDVGMLNPAAPSIAALPSFLVTGNAFQVGNGQNAEIDLKLSNSNTTGWFFLTPSGVAGFWDNTRALTRWTTDISGNFSAAGTVTGTNVTASSDERLKRDWLDLPVDFIEQLAEVKHGTYTRIDNGERQVGVSAQSLLPVLPEAVHGASILSVAYGNAALVAAIELSREVISLRDRIAALEVSK